MELSVEGGRGRSKTKWLNMIEYNIRIDGVNDFGY